METRCQPTPELPRDATAGRSKQRYLRFLGSGFAGLAGRSAVVLSTILTVPLVLRHLGEERYGLWATVIALTSVLSFADLGIGNGLITTLAQAHGVDDRHRARRLVSTAFFALTAISGAVGLAFSLIAPHIGWASLLNAVGSSAALDAGPSVAVLVAVFLVGLPLSVGQKVQLGLQEGFVTSTWQALGSIAGLAGVLVAVYLESGVPGLILGATGGPLLASLGQNTLLFFRRHPDLRPSLRTADRGASIELTRLGFAFFVMQVMMMLALTSDNLVLSRVRGVRAVTSYSIQAQPFLWITGVASVFLLPLWPAYGDALARREFGWVRSALRRSLVATVLVTAVPAMLVVGFARPLFYLWVGDSVEPEGGLLLSLALWAVCSALGAALSVLLNAAGEMRFQVVTSIAMGTTVIAAKFLGASRWGARGMVWGTLTVYVLLSLLPTGFYLRRWFKRGFTV